MSRPVLLVETVCRCSTRDATPSRDGADTLMLKRVVDLALAAAGLAVTSPLLLVLAIALRVLEGRPVLFRQARVGRAGRDFKILKFRTMKGLDAAEAGSFEPGSTSRVSRLGALLRRTKLDELPQLWNVIRGEMSLVGPRPEVRRWIEAYPQRWDRVLSVRPGITDPASIEFRNEEQLLAASSDAERMYREKILPRKLDLYERYVQERSLSGDVGILLRTVCSVVRG